MADITASVDSVSTAAGGPFVFEPYRLEPAERRLTRDGRLISLTPKGLDVLNALLERAGRLVSREELIQRVWPDTFVEEANLTYTVSLVRKALGDEAEPYRFIETVPRLGYRFVAPVRVEVVAAAPSHATGRPKRFVALTVVIAACGALALWNGARSSTDRAIEPPPAARYELTLPKGFMMSSGAAPAVSPDGRWLAVSGFDGTGRAGLWIRRLDATTMLHLPGTEGAVWPFWSPDSRKVGFFARDNLHVVDRGGGLVQTLVQSADWREAPFGPASWGRSGQILLTRSGQLHAVPEAGGSVRRILSVDASRDEESHWSPAFLPDGRHFLYSVRSRRGSSIRVGSLDSSETALVHSGGRFGVYSSGFVVFLEHLALKRVRFDPRTRRVAGTPERIADLTTGRFGLTDHGTIVARTAVHRRQMMWYSADGARRQPVGDEGSLVQLDLAPSDTRAAVVRWDDAGDTDLWIVDLENGRRTRAETGQTQRPSELVSVSDPVWSTDERRIAFTSRRSGDARAVVLDLTSGKAEQVSALADPTFVDDWARDAIIVRRRGVPHRVSPATLSASPMADTSSWDQLQVSPNADWIAYNARTPGGWQVFVARYPSFKDRTQVSVDGGVQPRWRRDGRELYFLAFDGSVLSAPLALSDASVIAGTPRVVVRRRMSPAVDLTEYDVAGDGRFLMLDPVEGPETLTVLLNWLTP